MYYGLYLVVSWLFFIIALPFFLLYCGFTGKHRNSFGQRLGFIRKSAWQSDNSLRIWLHAASVGEVQLAKVLIAELKKNLPDAKFVLSTFTEQGQSVAHESLGSEIPCIYAPIDLSFAVNKFLRIIKPTLYICLETELWPTMLVQAQKFGVKLLLLNGRISEGSFKHYLCLRGLSRKVLANFSAITVIQQDDARRFISLGANPETLQVLGNAKYDLPTIGQQQKTEDYYRIKCSLPVNQLVLVCGSTHTGEEKLLLQAFLALKALQHDSVWIVAPRHLRRLPEVITLFQEHNLSFELLSSIMMHNRRKADVILVDKMGELAGLYSVARYIFCGGSLINRGGHNVMEAALWGKPVFYGPNMQDFIDAKELLESAGAGFSVTTPGELVQGIMRFEDNPDKYMAAGAKASGIVLAQQGTAAKQAQVVVNILQKPSSAN